MSAIRVLGRSASINVRKVLWTAAEAEIDVVHENDWGLTRDLKSDEFRTLNPNGLIPVLVCDEGVLWESNAICRYLACRAGRTDLLPDAPFARAEVEKWMDWQAADLNAAWRPAFMALMRRSPEHMADRSAVERSVRAWNGLMLVAERRLEETDAYLAGESFTLADICMGLALQRWLLTPIDRPAAPALDAYRARLQMRPACGRSIEPDVP